MKKGKIRRLTLYRETLRRLDSNELTRAVGGSGSLTLTLCPECETEGGCGGGTGGSALSCTQFVCMA